MSAIGQVNFGGLASYRAARMAGRSLGMTAASPSIYLRDQAVDLDQRAGAACL